MALPTDADVTRFKPMLDFIAGHEGTASQPNHGYNTSLGFGIFLPGGKEQNLVGMTLLQIDVVQTQILHNPHNRFNSSAIGRYQIVGRTLRSLKQMLRIPDTQLFDGDLQDKLGVVLINGRGRSPAGLRLEWASLTLATDQQILDAFDATG